MNHHFLLDCQPVDKKITWSIIVASACLFVPLFVFQGIAWFDFWWWISLNIGILLFAIAVLDRRWRRELAEDFQSRLLFKAAVGALSAVLLYGIFHAGNILSRQMFSFADAGIRGVYQFRSHASPFRIALLMLVLIGPGEEFFWRGFVQRRLSEATGPWRGFLAGSTIYTLVHAASGNAMLVLAAGVCGVFWGFLYLRFKSSLLNAISHTLWDVAIFLIFPLSG